jgi:CheY-like chemotaxis protein
VLRVHNFECRKIIAQIRKHPDSTLLKIKRTPSQKISCQPEFAKNQVDLLILKSTVTPTLLNKKFLLADDDADDADIFCEALNVVAPLMEFHTVENGLELFELLAKDRPDIIFLDINMPVMDGWDCLRKLKANAEYRSIPAVMYSTSSAKKDVDMAYSLGAALFLTKPESFSRLSKILEIVATTNQGSLVSRLQEFEDVKVA